MLRCHDSGSPSLAYMSDYSPCKHGVNHNHAPYGRYAVALRNAAYSGL